MIKAEQGRMSLRIGQLGTNQRADKRWIVPGFWFTFVTWSIKLGFNHVSSDSEFHNSFVEIPRWAVSLSFFWCCKYGRILRETARSSSFPQWLNNSLSCQHNVLFIKITYNNLLCFHMRGWTVKWKSSIAAFLFGKELLCCQSVSRNTAHVGFNHFYKKWRAVQATEYDCPAHRVLMEHNLYTRAIHTH